MTFFDENDLPDGRIRVDAVRIRSCHKKAPFLAATQLFLRGRFKGGKNFHPGVLRLRLFGFTLIDAPVQKR